MRIRPGIAAVRPRVTIDGDPSGEPVLLAELVEARMAEGRTGWVHLAGPRGSGRTAALADVAERFEGRPRPFLFDGPAPPRLVPQALQALVLCTEPPPQARPTWESWTMAPWTSDERIEYLLARHPDQVASVMRRSEHWPTWCNLMGHAGLWAAVLDELARDERLGPLDALERACRRLIGSSGDRGLLERECLRRVFGEQSPALCEIDRTRGTQLEMLAEVEASRLLLAGSLVARSASGTRFASVSTQTFPRGLLAASAMFLPRAPEQTAVLRDLADSDDPRVGANAVGLLHLVSPPSVREIVARPEGVVLRDALHWPGAVLPGADWGALALRQILAPGADLARADLHAVRLGFGDLCGASLVEARLDDAELDRVQAQRTDFSRVSARGLCVKGGEFDGARFEGADLSNAMLERVPAQGAMFDRATLSGANLDHSNLLRATFRRADLRGARFWYALLGAVDLESAELDGASFLHADLAGAHLEGVRARGLALCAANLGRALLGGSRLADLNLRGANLREAGLAHVDWEGADLRAVDFTHASFHLGSTRSGLLLGAPVSWGTRTGFYDPDLVDLERRPPEQIRVANLARANLVDAKVRRCDFYLVDLRGARFTREQEAHFRACGAILDRQPLGPEPPQST